jgi:hypothetical protein
MQAPLEYHTIFTVLQKSPPWQKLVVIPAMAIIGAAVAIGIIIQRMARPALVLTVYAIFLLFAFYLFSGSGVRDMYTRAKNTYETGQYSVMEGTVTDFHPMPYSGHQEESFAINGVRFSYSDYILIPCFNNTTSHGGPIHEGLRVRIAYSGNCILKLEIAGNR